jgi:hypothetical protein
LYVVCGKHLLVAYLRTSKQDQAKHSWTILSLLAKRFRQEWPDVKIIFRGDSGFCRHEMFSWCERNKINYITGIGGNSRLKEVFLPTMKQAKKNFEETKEKQKLFGEFSYGARSWKKERRIIGKAEYTFHGANTRFVVTNIEGDSSENIYRNIYCARGDMENRIKEQQMSLFADKTSCHEWWANQLRLLLSSLAYTFINYIRINALKNTELENAQVDTIRLKLFKIGAVVIQNTRKVLFMMSSVYPYKNLFEFVYKKLVPI